MNPHCAQSVGKCLVKFENRSREELVCTVSLSSLADILGKFPVEKVGCVAGLISHEGIVCVGSNFGSCLSSGASGHSVAQADGVPGCGQVDDEVVTDTTLGCFNSCTPFLSSRTVLRSAMQLGSEELASSVLQLAIIDDDDDSDSN